MMEELLEMAKKAADQAEVYSLEERADTIRFENAQLKDIESKTQSGISLRLIKEGRLGFAYTKNLLNREELLRNALDSLKGGVEALFEFPSTMKVPRVESFDPLIEGFANSSLVEECQRVCDGLLPRTKGQINLGSSRHITGVRVINSRGADLTVRSSIYSFGAEILYPGSYASINRQVVDKKFRTAPDDYVDFISSLYNLSQREVTPKGGGMKLLFLPEALYALVWRLQSATNGRNIYQKVSPILDKKGEKVLDEKFTLFDDPLNDHLPDARGFDDEGTPCRTLSIFEQGILRNFYYDLFYAGKLKTTSTGHGYKGSMWGGETVSFKPSPALAHLFIRPGKKSFQDLIREMDQGIIVAGAMGAHSGNILNGDFSIGLSPGLYVEGGEIVGHVKDAMAAGNVFDVMKNIGELEDVLHPSYTGTFPAILFENVSVATKG
jgi:PmbA protein